MLSSRYGSTSGYGPHRRRLSYAKQQTPSVGLSYGKKGSSHVGYIRQLESKTSKADPMEMETYGGGNNQDGKDFYRVDITGDEEASRSAKDGGSEDFIFPMESENKQGVLVRTTITVR